MASTRDPDLTSFSDPLLLQGTMVGLAALSSQPQLASSISLAILMAPVAFTTAMTSPAFVLSARLRFEDYAVSLFGGSGEWGSFQQANSDVMLPLCRSVGLPVVAALIQLYVVVIG